LLIILLSLILEQDIDTTVKHMRVSPEAFCVPYIFKVNTISM